MNPDEVQSCFFNFLFQNIFQSFPKPGLVFMKFVFENIAIIKKHCYLNLHEDHSNFEIIQRRNSIEDRFFKSNIRKMSQNFDYRFKRDK